MKPTQFLAPVSGITERMAGFTAHLRAHGYNVGIRETHNLLSALKTLGTHDSYTLRLASQSIMAKRSDHYKTFDDLFDAYWLNHGRQKSAMAETQKQSRSSAVHPFRSGIDESRSGNRSGELDSSDDNQGDAASHSSGEGKLVGSRVRNLEKVDLREFMTPESIDEALATAKRLASAMSDRRSRRRIAATHGNILDLRRIMRHSISRGAEPFKLLKRQRPVRPVKIVALLDVSGSMMVYSRIFLAFLKGLVSHDSKTDAYLFHTSLVRISEHLREPDTLKAINALTLKAQGFGGGTNIGGNLEAFNKQYARHAVNGRTIVIILSDGYDTAPPERLGNALAKLKKRSCKIIWLNPLKGWKDYAPVAGGMQAALPYLDVFESANTLASLGALESHLARL